MLGRPWMSQHSPRLGSRVPGWCQLEPLLGWLHSCCRIVFHQGIKGQEKKPQNQTTSSPSVNSCFDRTGNAPRAESTRMLAAFTPGFSHHTCLPKIKNTDKPCCLHSATLPCSAGHFNMFNFRLVLKFH